MIRRVFPATVLAIAAVGLAGCGSSSSTPTMPTQLTQPMPATQPTYTLSGMVFLETPTGRIPLRGARVEEMNSHRSATTGSDGLYSISGLIAAGASVSASRWDVVTYTTTLAIDGDTKLDIELPTYTLSGVVFERAPTGTAPIEGVEVYCDGCGSPFGHTFAHTDADGIYRFAYTYSGTNPLQVGKPGYGDPVGETPGRRQPMVTGNTRFDIELVRR